MVTIRGDLQRGCLTGQLLIGGLGQPRITNDKHHLVRNGMVGPSLEDSSKAREPCLAAQVFLKQRKVHKGHTSWCMKEAVHKGSVSHLHVVAWGRVGLVYIIKKYTALSFARVPFCQTIVYISRAIKDVLEQETNAGSTKYTPYSALLVI